MPTNVPMMPFIILALLILPFRLTGQAMKTLAFALWMIGGVVLTLRGATFLSASPEAVNVGLMAGLVALALAIGFGKGKFMLSKTSSRNIERIDQFTEPKRPIQVYSMRSWIIIALMVGISVSLNIFQVPDLVRGTINIAIGFALIISSLTYVKALGAAKQASNPNEA